MRQHQREIIPGEDGTCIHVARVNAHEVKLTVSPGNVAYLTAESVRQLVDELERTRPYMTG
jgi:hypothetical protein